MPIWMRLFHISRINEHNKKQKEEIEKAQKGSTPTKGIAKPGVNPSSTYNF